MKDMLLIPTANCTVTGTNYASLNENNKTQPLQPIVHIVATNHLIATKQTGKCGDILKAMGWLFENLTT